MKRGPFDEYMGIDPKSTKSLELDETYWDSKMGIDQDHRYLVCSHTLGGLALKTRKWGASVYSPNFLTTSLVIH